MTKYKQIIIMRRDLKLPVGKAIVQGAHASQWALDAAREFGRGAHVIDEWNKDGCPKIVLGVDSEEELIAFVQPLNNAGVFPRVVHDLGRTVLPANTLTCLGVGPADIDVLDTVTGDLRLY